MKNSEFGMSYLSRVLTTTGLVKLIMLNVCGCLVLCWLVIDDPRRKPALVVLVPAMLLIDLLFVMRMFGNPKGASVSLPIIYLCGLAYGAWWLAKEFEWWKMPAFFADNQRSEVDRTRTGIEAMRFSGGWPEPC